MIFKQKFFLDLSGEEEGKQSEKQPAVVAPVKEKPAARAKTKAAPAAAEVPPAPAPEAPPDAPAGGQVLTTAEAIAAELAAAQANRPAPSVATFAPDCLVPGASPPRRRRTAGANLERFRDMAKGMMGG
jgi:hypothetical protein